MSVDYPGQRLFVVQNVLGAGKVKNMRSSGASSCHRCKYSPMQIGHHEVWSPTAAPQRTLEYTLGSLNSLTICRETRKQAAEIEKWRDECRNGRITQSELKDKEAEHGVLGVP